MKSFKVLFIVGILSLTPLAADNTRSSFESVPAELQVAVLTGASGFPLVAFAPVLQMHFGRFGLFAGSTSSWRQVSGKRVSATTVDLGFRFHVLPYDGIVSPYLGGVAGLGVVFRYWPLMGHASALGGLNIRFAKKWSASAEYRWGVYDGGKLPMLGFSVNYLFD